MATRGQRNALLARLEKRIQDAYAKAVRQAKSRAQINNLVRALERGDFDTILLAAGYRDGMWSWVTEDIRGAYIEGGAFVIAADVPKRFGMEFDINNPRAESWLRNNSSGLITGHLNPEQRAAIQVIMQDGMIKGKNPRSIALDIVGRIDTTGRRSGGVLGLSEQQAKYVTNAMDDLDNLNPRYFNRTLRDRRFDGVVRKSFESGRPLPQATKDKVVGRYEDRMLKHRGDTIGRTEALQSLNEASDEALRQVVDEGLAPKNAVTRIWRHSFSANEREGHLMMNGQRRGVDDYFTNPITGVPLKHPGDGPASEVINCRCYLEHSIDFAAVERAA